MGKNHGGSECQKIFRSNRLMQMLSCSRVVKENDAICAQIEMLCLIFNVASGTHGLHKFQQFLDG